MPRSAHALALLAGGLAVVLSACAGDDPATPAATAPRSATTIAGTPTTTPSPGTTTPGPATTTSPGTATSPAAPEGSPTRTPGRPATATSGAPPRSWTATCPTATKSPLGCRGVRGRVLSIQSVDPDGDGDLHVIAIGGDVTAPGITVFDVRPALRPRRDPEKGEWVTGAGPVFRGSLGQHQIQVDAFRVWRPRR